MPPKGFLRAEFERLKQFESVKSWLDSLGHKSEATERIALISLHRYLKLNGKDPDTLIKERNKDSRSTNVKVRFGAEDSVRAFAIRGGNTVYAGYIKSFYKANHFPLEVKLPSRYQKREREKIPTNEELFKLCTIAKGPLRPLLYFLIESGARIGSLLALRYRHIKEDFETSRIPGAVRFPAKITKGNIPYVGFVGKDSIQALREYLSARRSKGEKITDDSLLFISKNGKPIILNSVIKSVALLSYKTGINERKPGPRAFHMHVLRKRAQTILEGSGIPLNWVDYMLGHVPRGAVASAYSRPTEDQLRDSYRAALPKLAIRPIDVMDRTQLNLELKKLLLKMAGYGEDEMVSMDMSMSDEELQGLVRKKLFGALTSNGSRQKVIPISDVRNFIEKGWEYVDSLPDNSAIVKLPG